METKEILKQISETRRTLGEISKIINTWEKLKNEKISSISKLKELEKHAKRSIEKLPDSEIKRALLDWLLKAEADLKRYLDEARYTFAKDLAMALEKIGMKLEGRIPKFHVGPYGIEVDFDRSRAKILFGHDVVRDRVPLDIESILKALLAVKKEIERPIDPQKSVDLVFTAYLRALKIEGKPMGDRVPITEVLSHLVFLIQGPTFKSDPKRENFRGISRPQFAMMLYKIRDTKVKANNRYELYLTTATFDATRKRENFIWVPDNMRGEGTTYAFISFKEAKNLGGGRLL